MNYKGKKKEIYKNGHFHIWGPNLKRAETSGPKPLGVKSEKGRNLWQPRTEASSVAAQNIKKDTITAPGESTDVFVVWIELFDKREIVAVPEFDIVTSRGESYTVIRTEHHHQNSNLNHHRHSFDFSALSV